MVAATGCRPSTRAARPPLGGWSGSVDPQSLFSTASYVGVVHGEINDLRGYFGIAVQEPAGYLCDYAVDAGSDADCDTSGCELYRERAQLDATFATLLDCAEGKSGLEVVDQCRDGFGGPQDTIFALWIERDPTALESEQVAASLEQAYQTEVDRLGVDSPFDHCPAPILDAMQGERGRAVVVEEGGTVRKLTRAADLAPIETPQAAVLALWLEGAEVRLDDAWARPRGSGFLVHVGASKEAAPTRSQRGVDWGGCRERQRVTVYRNMIRVERDGQYEQVMHRVVGREIRVNDDDCHQHGRRAEGACRPVPGRDGVRSYLQRVADDEAEAVVAFERLARELAFHQAPTALVDAANAAVQDERRHVQIACKAAEALGTAVSARPRHRALGVRSLEAVLTENAVEGCVLETHAAAVALYQSQHAQTPALRQAFAEIAHDELDHAALAHAIEEALLPRLDAAAQRRVARARARAMEALAQTPAEPRTETERLMGHPPTGFRPAFCAELASGPTNLSCAT